MRTVRLEAAPVITSRGLRTTCAGTTANSRRPLDLHPLRTESKPKCRFHLGVEASSSSNNNNNLYPNNNNDWLSKSNNDNNKSKQPPPHDEKSSGKSRR